MGKNKHWLFVKISSILNPICIEWGFIWLENKNKLNKIIITSNPKDHLGPPLLNITLRLFDNFLHFSVKQIPDVKFLLPENWRGLCLCGYWYFPLFQSFIFGYNSLFYATQVRPNFVGSKLIPFQIRNTPISAISWILTLTISPGSEFKFYYWFTADRLEYILSSTKIRTSWKWTTARSS